MKTWDEEQLDRLRLEYPGWDLWIIRRYMPRGIVWCAKPGGAPVATINCGSPEELVSSIAGSGLLP